ncbi:MAG: hypothetical protein AUJ92_21795 [Armatimonadetes bacterium CG2_30_59_28]|nr:MAG: hypothetical protein AUJ92_21795 [Armatimonadetes bacterium CG2_30_59_28]
MAASTTVTYPDSLFFDALMQVIRESEKRIRIATFIFKLSYAQRTRPHEVFDALAKAVTRGVSVEVALNHSRYERDVSEENYATALASVPWARRCTPKSWSPTSAACLSAVTTLPAAD